MNERGECVTSLYLPQREEIWNVPCDRPRGLECLWRRGVSAYPTPQLYYFYDFVFSISTFLSFASSSCVPLYCPVIGTALNFLFIARVGCETRARGARTFLLACLA